MLLREDRAGWPYSVWLLMFPAATLVLILAAITQATATATVVAAENDSGAPEQVHISLAGANHMRVSWITFNSSAPSIVEYGENSNDYDNMVQGENTTYSYILYNSGLIHNAVLGPLEDNKVYYYRCGGVGPEYSFKMPPTSGANVSVIFVIVGTSSPQAFLTKLKRKKKENRKDIEMA
eukprot:c20022_g1_i4 orf=194-730(-)